MYKLNVTILNVQHIGLMYKLMYKLNVAILDVQHIGLMYKLNV